MAATCVGDAIVSRETTVLRLHSMRSRSAPSEVVQKHIDPGKYTIKYRLLLVPSRTVVYDIKIIKSSAPQIMIRTLPKPSPVMKNLSLWTFDVFKLEYGPTKSSHRSTYSKTRIFIYFTFGSITNYWLDISKKCYKAKCLVSIGAQKTYLDHLQFF